MSDKIIALIQLVSGLVGFVISVGCLIALVRLLREMQRDMHSKSERPCSKAS